MTQIVSEVPLSSGAVARLQSLPDVELIQLPPHEEPWDLAADMLSGPEVMLCKRVPRNIKSLSRLKLLQLSTVGYEHLRERGLAQLPVRVCNARGVFDNAIAEWNLAMMVNLTRDLRDMLRHQEQSVWDRRDHYQQEICGKVIGLWGYGGIGRATARLARACGMRVHVMTRSGVKARLDTFMPPGLKDRTPCRIRRSRQARNASS